MNVGSGTPHVLGLAVGMLGSFLLTWLGGRLIGWLALRQFDRTAVAPWIERARIATSARSGVVTIAFVTVPVTALLAIFWSWTSPASCAGLAAASSVLGGVFAFRSVDRRVGVAGRSRADELRGGLAMLVLAWSPILALVMAMILAGTAFDMQAVIALGLATAAFIGAHGGGCLALARRLGLVRPASPRLLRAVADAGGGTQEPPIAVFELPVAAANAFALTGARAMLVSDGAQDALDDAQLAAVCAHEIGHLTESAHAHRLRAVQAYLLLPAVLVGPVFGTFHAADAIFVCLVAMLAVLVVLGRIRTRMQALETDADHHGAELDPVIYARALERIYEVNLVPPVLAGRTVHPDLYDRMLAVGVQPDYPRPAPPPAAAGSFTLLGVWTAVLVGALLLAVLVVRLPAFAAREPANGTPAWQASRCLAESSEATTTETSCAMNTAAR